MRRVDNYPLWIGHSGDLSDPRGISERGIIAVVDVALNERPAPIRRDLVYVRFPLADGSGNPPWLVRAAIETLAALIRAQVPTLVCCSAGVSRSPTVAAAALALLTGFSPRGALPVITQTGPVDISPALWAEVERIVVECQSEPMPALYREGGQERRAPPQVVYRERECPDPGCGEPMQAIDFRLEDHGRAVHDPLVRAWWNDTGFVGRCPQCGGWIHFTIRAKRAVTEEEAAGLPKLPDNWHVKATVL
jgi:hypothetical protein